MATDETIEQPDVETPAVVTPEEQAAAQGPATATAPEPLPMVRKIADNGKVYIYEFAQLNTERMAFAEEVFEYKRQQLQQPAKNFEQVLGSGGVNYMPKALSALFLPVLSGDKGDTVDRDFDANKRAACEKWVKNLPAEHYLTLKEVCQDFFAKIGKSDLGSSVLSRDELNVNDLLFAYLQKMGNVPNTNDN